MSDVTILHGYRMPNGAAMDYAGYGGRYGDVQWVPADIADPVPPLDGYGLMAGGCCSGQRQLSGAAEEAGISAFALIGAGLALYWLLRR